MKTKFFRLVLPAAVICFAIAGAVSTNAMNKKAATLVDRWGYAHLEDTPCKKEIMCSTDNGPVCKNTAGDILYDFVSTTSCPNTLNKKQ